MEKEPQRYWIAFDRARGYCADDIPKLSEDEIFRRFDDLIEAQGFVAGLKENPLWRQVFLPR